MWVWRWKVKHIFFNPNIKRIKSDGKYKKVIEQSIRLMKREKTEWPTKRILNAKKRCDARIKKYGISQEQINTVIDRKASLTA